MKHQSSRDLFAYWDERRGERVAPERADIDPAAIRHVLGDTFVLEGDDLYRYRLRLAGTRLCALFARELKGESFTALWQDSNRNDIRDLLTVVVTERNGVVASANCAPHDDRQLTLPLELLLLPFASHRRGDARVLGVLAPMAVPYWLGAKPIGALALGAFRHLGTSIKLDDAPTVVPRATPIRPGLTVYEGGRTD